MDEIVNKIHELMTSCLAGSEPDVIVEGILNKYGFNKAAIEAHRDEIRELLNLMPAEFHKRTGGGSSFLRLCMTKDGGQWGEHFQVEQLIVLGVAAGLAQFVFPRQIWGLLPGGMPYVVFDTEQTA